MAGLFSRLSQRVLAPQGNVQAVAVNRAPDIGFATGLPADAGVAESSLPARASAPQGPTNARPAPQPRSDAETLQASPARDRMRVTRERVTPFESAALMPLPPSPIVPVSTTMQRGFEEENVAPRRMETSADTPPDPVREIARAAQDIVPRLAATMPARRASREALPARATESTSGSPVIQVTIDRIDVHHPPVPAPAPRAPPAQSSRISLGDYLSAARRKP